MRLLSSVRWLLLALVVTVVTLVPPSSQAGVFISVGFAPPVLPVYVQPVCPQPGLMWTPGYWAYGDDGYYWVPGAWVPSPYVGALWTPGYWGWGNGLYVWHGGYWGPHVGYYGGVNYGFGYGGIGFFGGRWNGGLFAYNTAVMHVGVGGGWGGGRVYEDRTIIQRNTIVNNNHVSYNGGPGGINHQPAPEERLAEHDQHTGPTSFQAQHENTFRSDHNSYAKVNGGHPQNAAISRPLGGETRPANVQNHGNLQQNARPQENARPMDRPESVNHSSQPTNPRPQQNARPMDRPESVNHGEGNPHPNNAPAARPAPHPESRPAPQSRPKPEEKEHEH
jgi:hypothetical protein